MLLEIATWVADQRKDRGEAIAGTAGSVVNADGIVERTVAPGVVTSRIETDPASMRAFVAAVEAGATAEEAFAALDNAVPDSDDADEAERLIRAILTPR
jgi:hypothetical protein